MKKHTIAALAGVAAVAGCLVVAATAGAGARAGAAAPKISFRQDAKKPGFYVVTTSPPSRLRVSLVAFSMCDLTGAHCSNPEVIDTEWLPKAATHSVSWGVAEFWQQPDGDDEGGLYPGTYKVIMAIPGTKVSTSAQYKISPPGD